MKRFLAVCLCLVMALVLGCPKKKAVEEAEKPSPGDALWAEVRELFEMGKTNEVFRVLEAALTDEEMAPFKAGIVREIISLHLSLGDRAKAQERFLMLAEDAEQAALVFGMIEHEMIRNKEYDALIDWCERLLAGTFPDAVRRGAVSYLLEAYRAVGNIDKLLEILPRVVLDFPPETAGPVVDGLLATMLREEEYVELELVLVLLEGQFADRAGFPAKIAAVRLRSLLARAELEQAEKVLLGAVRVLPDRTAAELLGMLTRQAVKAGKPDVADRVCKAILDINPPDGRLMQRASREWVLLGQVLKQPAGTLERLETVVKLGGAAELHLRLLNEVFYFIMQDGDQEAKDGVMALCLSLRDGVDADEDKYQATVVLLDGCFMLGDFGRALTIVRAGLPGKDEQETTMLAVKIEAHKAEAEGNLEEAIAKFRAFMAAMSNAAEKVEVFKDPISGLRVSLDEVLGLNAARIGRLWTKLGNGDKAKAAFTEARGHYQKALAEAKDGSDEQKAIRAELAKIPAAE